jgi:hypothetical protein
MLLYSIRVGRSGWFIDNGAICYGPYKREDKAVAAAESLNRQARERSLPYSVPGRAAEARA